MFTRPRRRFSILLLFAALALVAAACGTDEEAEPAAAPETQATTTTAAMVEEAPTTTEAMEEAPATTEAMAEEATTTTAAMEEMMGTMVDVPMYDTWEDVLAAADGTTVNWHMWGGNENLNSWVDTYIGDVVKERYNVTLNRVPLGDTVEAVNLVLNEHQAGVTEGGSVDMIWINGDNFKTLKEADLLFGPWSEGIPNAAHVNWDDPSISYDFGVSVDGLESPWGSAQMVFVYNSAFVPEPPGTFEALAEWVHANPGLFTYPAPPDFHGLSFVKHMFYWAADDYSVFQQPFDQAVFDSIAPEGVGVPERHRARPVARWRHLSDQYRSPAGPVGQQRGLFRYVAEPAATLNLDQQRYVSGHHPYVGVGHRNAHQQELRDDPEECVQPGGRDDCRQPHTEHREPADPGQSGAVGMGTPHRYQHLDAGRA